MMKHRSVRIHFQYLLFSTRGMKISTVLVTSITAAGVVFAADEEEEEEEEEDEDEDELERSRRDVDDEDEYDGDRARSPANIRWSSFAIDVSAYM